jgi:hypothetical protein
MALDKLNEILKKKSIIKSYDPTIHGTRTEVKANMVITVLDNNFELWQGLLNYFKENVMLGGDYVEINVNPLAVSGENGKIDMDVKITTNINFSDYKDEQEIIDWFIMQQIEKYK